jgi:hypothetical protein
MNMKIFSSVIYFTSYFFLLAAMKPLDGEENNIEVPCMIVTETDCSKSDLIAVCVCDILMIDPNFGYCP